MVEIDTGTGEHSGICLFCEKPNSTYEHAWPDWLCRFIIERLAPTQRSAVRAQIELKVPMCGDCNHKWMKALEDAVNPLLKVMFDGTPQRLDQRSTRFLRRWAVKTALVFERVHGNELAHPLTKQSLRQGGMPFGATVLLGRYVGEDRLDQSRSYFPVPAVPPLVGVVNTSWTTLTIGQVFLAVLTDSAEHPSPHLTDAGQRFFTDLPRGGAVVNWPAADPIGDDIVGVIRLGPNPELRRLPRITR